MMCTYQQCWSSSCHGTWDVFFVASVFAHAHFGYFSLVGVRFPAGHHTGRGFSRKNVNITVKKKKKTTVVNALMDWFGICQTRNSEIFRDEEKEREKAN